MDTSQYPLRIMGIDPGGTNGIVLCRLTQHDPLEVQDYKEEGDMFRACEYVKNFIAYNADYGHTGLLIVESFKSLKTDFHVDANVACQPIGIIRWLAREYSAAIRLQPPQERLFITDDVMKASGYWLRGGAGHMRQALKHVLTYVSRTVRHRPTIEKLHPRTSD